MDEISLPSGSKYLEYLNKIWSSRWGSENRPPIYNAIGTFNGFKEIDISEELEVIATATKGNDIRMAIYSALNKIWEVASIKPEPMEPMAYSFRETTAISNGYVTDDICGNAQEVQ